MNASPVLEDAINLRRVQLLYGKLPAGIVSGLFGVLVVFAALLEVSAVEAIKPWTSYMLSTLALRGCIWYAFSTKELQPGMARHWELLFTCGALLTGLGWGVLNGPLYPINHPEVHEVFFLVAVMVSFSAAVYCGASDWAFAAILIPTLLPAVWRFSSDNSVTIVASSLAVTLSALMIVAVQFSLRRTLLGSLRRSLENVALLDEQQAIFQSATLGIAVVDGKSIVKANPRLAEILGRQVGDMQKLPLVSHFVNVAELDQMLEQSEAAFRRAHSFHGAFRLQRADGSQFWAEFSGRRMDGEDPLRSVWLISEAPLRSPTDRRQQPDRAWAPADSERGRAIAQGATK